MELSIKERILLSGIIPTTGDLLTLQVARRGLDALAFTEDEIKLFELSTADGAFKWNQETARDVDIKLEDASVSLIRSELKRKSESRELTIDMLSLCEKIL
jgi:hypothetical protein